MSTYSIREAVETLKNSNVEKLLTEYLAYQVASQQGILKQEELSLRTTEADYLAAELIPANTYTADVHSAMIDVSRFREASFFLGMLSGGGASMTFKVYIYSLDLLGNKYLIAEFQSFTTVTNPPLYRLITVPDGLGTKILCSAILGGTSPSYRFFLHGTFKK